jgi:Tfp pilus assembly protein PilN
MIEINLLPEEFRKRQIKFKLEIPPRLIIGGLVTILLIHLSLAIITSVRKIQLDNLNKRFPEIEAKRRAYDNLKKEIEILEKNKSVLEQLKVETLWSKKLNFISDNIPKGVWLRKLSFSKDKFKIEGSCVSKKFDETERIRNFLNKLRSEFGNLELGALTRRSIKGQDVVDFVFSGEFKIK